MLKSEITKKEVWIMLVMINDSYIPGAIAVAESLRQVNTSKGIVCMITPDISASARHALSIVCDQVIEVSYIQHTVKIFTSIKQKELYNAWIDKSFTKWACLSLIQFTKVIMVDVDMIFTTNCDELFDLGAPAACFSLPWAYPYQDRGGIYNPYIKSNSEWERKKDIPHGSQISYKLIESSLYKKTFVSNGFITILEPSIDDYNLLLSLIYKFPIYGKLFQSTGGPDETSLSLLYILKKQNMTHIHQKFAAIPWKPKWVSELRAIHYLGGTKPWNMNIDEWPDLQNWWDIAKLASLRDPLIKQIMFPTAFSLNDLEIETTNIVSLDSKSKEIYDLDMAVAELRLTNDIIDLMCRVSISEKIKFGEKHKIRIENTAELKEILSKIIPNKDGNWPIYSNWIYNTNSITNKVDKLIETRTKTIPRQLNAQIELTKSGEFITNIKYGSQIEIDLTDEIKIDLTDEIDKSIEKKVLLLIQKKIFT